MLSTPPAIYRSPSPARMARKAVFTAVKPEAHSRLNVTAGTVCGKPASKVAMRATLRLSSPAWLAQPRYTSSTAAASILFLSRMLFSTRAARSSGLTLARPPPSAPIGVRTASTITTSFIVTSTRWMNCFTAILPSNRGQHTPHTGYNHSRLILRMTLIKNCFLKNVCLD